MGALTAETEETSTNYSALQHNRVPELSTWIYAEHGPYFQQVVRIICRNKTVLSRNLRDNGEIVPRNVIYYH